MHVYMVYLRKKILFIYKIYSRPHMQILLTHVAINHCPGNSYEKYIKNTYISHNVTCRCEIDIHTFPAKL